MIFQVRHTCVNTTQTRNTVLPCHLPSTNIPHPCQPLLQVNNTLTSNIINSVTCLWNYINETGYILFYVHFLSLKVMFVKFIHIVCGNRSFMYIIVLYYLIWMHHHKCRFIHCTVNRYPCIVFSLGLLWTLVHSCILSFGEHVYPILQGLHPRMDLLGHRLYKVLVQIFTLTSSIWEFHLL